MSATQLAVRGMPPLATPIADEPRLGRRLAAGDFAIALVIALVTMVVTWHWRAALIPIDPWDYVEGALHFPNGIWNEVGLSRWGMIGPLLLFARLWGDAELTYYAYPLLASGLLAGTLYGLAARVVNRRTGVAAAFFVLTIPVVFVHLARGYPDLIALALVSFALLSLLLAGDAARASDAPSGPAASLAPNIPMPSAWEEPTARTRVSPATIGWLLLAGLAVGWAFEVRELAVLAFPALGVALLRVGRPLVTWPVFAALPLAAVALDIYLCAQVFGDPLLRIHALSGNSIAQSIVAKDAVYVGHDRWYYLSIPFRILGARSGGPLLLAMMLLGLIGGALMWKRLWSIWLWGTSVFLMLWASGGVLRPAAPAIRLDIVRYNLAYAVPLVLTAICVIGVLLVHLRGRRRRAMQIGALVLAASALVPAVRFATTFEGLAPNGGDALRDAAAFLQTRSDVPDSYVWADWGTQRLLPVYTRAVTGGSQNWAPADFYALNRLARREHPQAERPQPGDYVVVFSQDDETCYHCARALEEVETVFGQFPLAGWQEVYRGGEGNVVIYQLPAGYSWPDRPQEGGPQPAPAQSGKSNSSE